MNKSGRRVLRTTAAVVGMTALGAAYSGTAFADTDSDYGDSADGYQNTDYTGSDGDSALPVDALDVADLHSFDMPTAGPKHGNVAKPKPSSSSDDSDSSSSDSSDDEDSDNSTSGGHDSDVDGDDDSDIRDSDKNDDNDKDSGGGGALAGLL